MLSKKIFFKNNLTKFSRTSLFNFTKNSLQKIKEEYFKGKIPMLSSFNKNYELGYSKKFLKKINSFYFFNIVGIGGSVLGAKAIYSFLRNKIKKKFNFIDNLSEINLLNKNEKKFKEANIFISKSGNTLETIVNLNFFLKKNKKNNTNLFIVEKKYNGLREMADKLRCQVIEHKNFIGGRYSVMSETGMLPAQLMGLNPNKFKNLNYLIKNKNFVNDLISNVSSISKLINKKNYNSVILNYDPDINDFCLWYQQLMAESLGKKNKGIFPIISTMPKDNHSLFQLYLDGPRNNFFTIFFSKHITKINLSNSFLPKKFQYLKNKNLENILSSQKKATENIFNKKKIPYRSFYILKKDEEQLGVLFTFFVLETILLSKFLKINPFDQPAVENIKKTTKNILLKI